MVEGGGGGGYGRRDWVKVVVVGVFGMCVVVEDGSGCLTRAMVVLVAVGGWNVGGRVLVVMVKVTGLW